MRIVSLLPSATEIACSLGLREQLVGVSHECDHPADVRALPVLTASILDTGLSPKAIDSAVREAKLDQRPLYTVDGARLRELKPDLILTQGVCSVCAVTPETIAASVSFAPVEAEVDAPVLSLEAVDFAGILADIEAVAQAAKVEARGRALTDELRSGWAQLSEATAAVEAPPSALFLEWPDPPWYAGHWVPEQLAVAGGRDAFATPGATSRPLSWEDILAVDPEFMIVGACGCDLDTNSGYAELLREHPVASQLRAFRDRRCWAVDANAYFSRPGPRVLDGARLLADLLAGRSSARVWSGARRLGLYDAPGSEHSARMDDGGHDS